MSLSPEKPIDYRKDGRTIRRTILLNAPITRVWKALSTTAGLASWLLPNNFQPIVGASFTFTAESQEDWNGVVTCQVVEIDEPYKLAFTWSEDSGFPPTLVSFELHELHGKTEICLVHSQREHLPEEYVSRLDQGWGCNMLRRLAEIFEQE